MSILRFKKMDENLSNNEVESEQIMLIHKVFTESDVVIQTTTALSILRYKTGWLSILQRISKWHGIVSNTSRMFYIFFFFLNGN